MADYQLDYAIENLDKLSDNVQASLKSGKYDNNAVMWMIKVWTKVSIIATGPYHKMASGKFLMKREPPKNAGKWVKTLSAAVDAYLAVLEKNRDSSKGAGNSFFKAADEAMLHFVWDYWRQLKANQEKQFLLALTAWKGMTEEKIMELKLIPMDGK